MDQTYSIWHMNSSEAKGNTASSIIAGTSGRHLRIVNLGGQGTPAQLVETATSTACSDPMVYGSGTSDLYQHHSAATIMTEPILLQLPDTRQYLVDESSIQNIDQMPPVNLIMGTTGDVCDESPLVAAHDGEQVFRLTTEQQTTEVAIDEYDTASGKMMPPPPNDNFREHTHYTEECEVMEEVITDDWVQSQGEECVQVTVDQLGASTIAGTVEDDISVPLDQDEYTLSRPFPCDFCSRRFRKKATLLNHLVAHSNDRPHVCNLCGAQYGRRIDLTNHFKQHAYAANNLDETALRSDQEIEYDITGLSMPHHNKQRTRQSSEDEDLFNEGSRAVNYNSQPPMQLISSTTTTQVISATDAYSGGFGVRLQLGNDPTVVGISSIEDGSYSYAPPVGEGRNSGTSRRTHSTEPSHGKRQTTTRAGKTTSSKGNRRNVANSHVKKQQIATNVACIAQETVQQQIFPVVDERKPFVCQQCGVSFGREKALASHSRVHGGDMQYQCMTCDERFWDRVLLQGHIRQKHPDVCTQVPSGSNRGSKRSSKTHTATKHSSFAAEARSSMNEESFRIESNDGGGQYVCDSCFMVFDRPELLKNHIQMVHGSAEATCSKNIGSNRSLKQEMSDVFFDVTNGPESGEQFALDDGNDDVHSSRDEPATSLCCDECNQTFEKKSDLQAHNNQVHFRDELHECQLCGEKFLNESIIKNHVQECHRDELTDSSCVVCGKLCKNQNSLIKHSYDHSRERAHSCWKCGKTFHHMGRLKRHMVSHRNKTVRCEVCEEEFPDGRTLMNHRHSHSKSNNYPCKECGKTFGSRSSQQIHMRIHTGERPYACRFCWKAFADGGTLRKHERVHTGEKPYGCSVCPKEFNQRVVLREHIRAHHSQPDTVRGNDQLPYYCPVCSTLFSAAVDLIQHLIEHSDNNTAKKRTPPAFPRKYKRRRKLKPQELERLQSGRRKQKSTSKTTTAKKGDDEEHDRSIENEAEDNGQQQYERGISLERDDGTLKTTNDLFLEYGGDSSKTPTLTVASSQFISPYELLTDTAAGESNGARGKDRANDGMLDDIGINLLSTGEAPVQAPLDKATSNVNNNDHVDSVGKRRSMRGSGTVVSTKSSVTGSGARMIRTEPTTKRASVANSKSSTKKNRKRAVAVPHSISKEPLVVSKRDEEIVSPAAPESSSVSHAMEGFSELARKRSRTRAMPSYVREIPSSKISANFPLLDDGSTEDTMEESLMEGCSDDRSSSRSRYGSRQRYISTTSTASAATARDEEDEQLLMEISRGDKYTDRFNSDIVNDLAEILRSPVKGTTFEASTAASSIPPVDILASPSSRHAVLLPPIKAEPTVQPNNNNHRKSRPPPARAKVQSTTTTKQPTKTSNVITTAASAVPDSETISMLYSHGRRLTRRQLEREVNFLTEAYAPVASQPGPSTTTHKATLCEAVPAISIGKERSIVVKQESMSAPEKLAEMLLNDGIPISTGSSRNDSSERQEISEHYPVTCGEFIPKPEKLQENEHRRDEQQEMEINNGCGLSSRTTSKLVTGYRCSICGAHFADRSQLILHVPVHM